MSENIEENFILRTHGFHTGRKWTVCKR